MIFHLEYVSINPTYGHSVTDGRLTPSSQFSTATHQTSDTHGCLYSGTAYFPTLFLERDTHTAHTSYMHLWYIIGVLVLRTREYYSTMYLAWAGSISLPASGQHHKHLRWNSPCGGFIRIRLFCRWQWSVFPSTTTRAPRRPCWNISPSWMDGGGTACQPCVKWRFANVGTADEWWQRW